MQFPYNILNNANPIVRGLYQSTNDQGEDFPPPEGGRMITEIDSNLMITENGDQMIIEGS